MTLGVPGRRAWRPAGPWRAWLRVPRLFVIERRDGREEIGLHVGPGTFEHHGSRPRTLWRVRWDHDRRA